MPTPIGHIAESPEIADAFEQAVKDGMDVINFSGGGPQAEPLNDVLDRGGRTTSRAAGVVPVIAAGNDRDDFGFGTAGSPGTAPDAISVAAVSNSQVFAPALGAFDRAGAGVLHVPIQTGGSTPAAWASANQTLVDVGTIIGRNGQPVDRHLCGSGADPNGSDEPAARELADRRDRARLARHVLVRVEGGSRAGRPARSGSSSSTTASARPTRSRSSCRSRAG